MLKKIVGVIGLMSAMSSVHAIEGFYFGAGYNFDSGETSDPNYEIEDKAASSINLTYGYNLNRYLGIEVKGLIGFTGTESGIYKANCTFPEPDDSAEGVAAEDKCRAEVVDQIKLKSQAAVNLKLGVPLSEYVTLMGKYGYAYSDFEVEKKQYDSRTGDLIAGSSKTTSIHGYSNTMGVGLGFEMKSGAQIELMYNKHFDDKEIEYSGLQLGYIYNF